MAAKPSKKREAAKTKPVLLSGGNPQIPKGYGEKPAKAYLAAVPGWKRTVCRRIDGIVSDLVPGVKKAIKWNSPFYGVKDDRYFLSFHCFERYVKITFFQATCSTESRPEPRSIRASATSMSVRMTNSASNSAPG